jgi:AbiU2
MPIPTELAEIWQFLHNEVAWLHGRWTMYRQLYGTSPERIELLNQLAPTFFGTIQAVQVDEIQLTLSRLGDPAGTGKRRNLTLETLLQEIEALGIDGLAAELRPLLLRFRETCEGIAERRNKVIAHNDFQTRQPGANAIAGASREEIEGALDALRAFMRAVYAFFEGSHMAYEHFAMIDDANSLLWAAKEALRYRELTDAGTIDAGDIARSAYWTA